MVHETTSKIIVELLHKNCMQKLHIKPRLNIIFLELPHYHVAPVPVSTREPFGILGAGFVSAWPGDVMLESQSFDSRC